MLPRLFVNAAAVTPSDSASNDFEALYIGVSGNVRVETEGANDVTFVAVPAGAVLYIRVRKVFATNTTASSIVGFR